LRLLIDENISPEITNNLRLLGYDIKSVRECCKGCHDEKIVEIAKEEERIIITFDLDFGELYRNLGTSSIVLRLRTKNSSLVLKYLLDFLRTISEQKIDMRNKLAILKEGKIRLIG
jgi:predicted nuclease of predicted toxin-antitoxin system